MAGFLYLRYKDGHSFSAEVLNQVASLLRPTGLPQGHTYSHFTGQAALVVTDEAPYIAAEGLSLVLGHFRALPADWPRTPPDSLELPFLLQHADASTTLKTDTLGARSCWYYHEEDFFLASSSQRALIAWLGSFHLNAQVIPWWLTNGNLGPGLSWDSRLQRLEPGTSLKLRADTWVLRTETKPFTWPERVEPVTSDQLRRCMFNSFNSFQLPGPDYLLTLSGGYDSRVVLYHLKRLGLQVKVLTWGLSSTLTNPQSDAYLAQQVARHFQVPHRFVALDPPQTPDWHELLRAFVQVGEARIDHLYHGIDQFAMFRQLSAEGVRGFIRADEVFGWLPAQTERDARVVIDAALPKDYENLRNVGLEQLFPEPTWPEVLQHHAHESVPMWRDRLYINYRQPYVMSALHTLHLGYLEECNPLVSPEIVRLVGHLTDRQRTLKMLYRQAVHPWVSAVPIATVTSHPQTSNLLSTGAAVEYLGNTLTARGSELFHETLIALALADLRHDEHRASSALLKRWQGLYRFIPPALKKAIRNRVVGYRTQPNLLALRMVLALLMKDEMTQAAASRSSVLAAQAQGHRL